LFSGSSTTSLFASSKPAGNTDVAQTTSLFGSSKPAGNTNVAQTTSLFGSSKPAGNMDVAQTTSLFGSSKPAGNTDVAQNTSLFGSSKPAGNTDVAQTTSLFGKSSGFLQTPFQPNETTPTQQSSLFDKPSPTFGVTDSSRIPNPGGSIFGTSQRAPLPAQNQGGMTSLFGSSQNAFDQKPLGIFGATESTPLLLPHSSPFGTLSSIQQPPATSLFGTAGSMNSSGSQSELFGSVPFNPPSQSTPLVTEPQATSLPFGPSLTAPSEGNPFTTGVSTAKPRLKLRRSNHP